MNKKVLISLAGAALLSAGLTTAFVESNTSVDAAKTTLAKGKHKKLARNARIYTSKGKKTKKKTLKKGKKLKILGFKTIKGKKYVRIGKNQYVLAVNFKAKKVKKHTTDSDKPYTKEAAYKKYMSWINKSIKGNGGIVAIRKTSGMQILDPYLWVKNPKSPFEGDTPVAKGDTLSSLSDVFKINGKYYLTTYDDDAGSVMYPAKDFAYKTGKELIEMAGFESAFDKNALKLDPKLKSLKKAFDKVADKDDESNYVILIANKNAQLYENKGNWNKYNLQPIKSVSAGTRILANDDTNIIKYNGEYYYAFKTDMDDDGDYGETYNSHLTTYIKVSDVNLSTHTRNDDAIGYYNQDPVTDDDD